MYKYFLILLLVCPHGSADPFHADEPQTQVVDFPQKFAKNPPDLTACPFHSELNAVYITTPFEQLTLNGLIRIDDQFTALFLDEKGKTFFFKQHDLLQPEFIQISDIDLQSVNYLNWKLSQNCQVPKPIKIKL